MQSSEPRALFWSVKCPEAAFVFQLMSCGIYQRGGENEGVFGFLVDDIKREIRRSARLVRPLSWSDLLLVLPPHTDVLTSGFQICRVCRTNGASIGCNVRSCRSMVHFPCSRKMHFICQYTGLFP